MNKINLYFSILIVLIIVSCKNDQKLNVQNAKDEKNPRVDTADFTNDFYDNAETYDLKTNDLFIEGEISNPGKAAISNLKLRSIIVKETLIDGDGDQFVGAYKYEGYSLYDLLNQSHLDKRNADSFKPIIDLFVEVENEVGEKAVFSWGEIFYPNHLHEIIIATKVTRIVPSKTNELWDLPADSKIVVASDLITERNIAKPKIIRVKSYPKNLIVEKGKYPLFSPKVDFYFENEKKETLFQNPKQIPETTLHTIFYGRGRGIHSTQPFTGIDLKTLFKDKIDRSIEAIREGLFVMAADDGYRAVFSYSEVCNRNDQADILMICNPEVKTDGIFRLFPSCDFFSDRAIKGLNAIYYSEHQK